MYFFTNTNFKTLFRSLIDDMFASGNLTFVKITLKSQEKQNILFLQLLRTFDDQYKGWINNQTVDCMTFNETKNNIRT